MDPIGRKHLPHQVPEGVSSNPENEVFFITVCCARRGGNQLAIDSVWRELEEALLRREEAGLMKVRLALAMPDHFHGLLEFPGSKPMTRVIAGFKEWVAKQTGVRWQRDFFDHRLRTWESGAEKAEYIRQNPVRAGLVERSEDWPFQIGGGMDCQAGPGVPGRA